MAPIAFLSFAAAAVALLLPPRYRASALVRAESELGDEALLQQRGVDVDARRTQAVRQRVTEPAVLEHVLREASPYPGLGGAQASLEPQVERLLSDLRVRSMASSTFVIEFVHRDPATAARVPNLIALRLASGAGSVGRAGDSAGSLEARLEQARQVLKQKTAALGRARPTEPQANADEVDAPAADEAAFAEARAVAASLATARARADRLRLVTEDDSRSGAAPTPQAELERLRGELAELRKRYTEEHPDVERLRRQIVRLEASVSPAPPGPPTPQEELRATEAEIETLEARQAQLEALTAPQARAGAPARAAPSPTADPERQQAVLEQQRAERAYRALLEEWQAAQAAAPAVRGPVGRFELVRDAAIPRTPESPRPLLFVLAAAIAGLAIGLVAALVAEHRDRSVKGPEHLEEVLPVPLLATLPLVRERDRRG